MYPVVVPHIGRVCARTIQTNPSQDVIPMQTQGDVTAVAANW